MMQPKAACDIVIIPHETVTTRKAYKFLVQLVIIHVLTCMSNCFQSHTTIHKRNICEESKYLQISYTKICCTIINYKLCKTLQYYHLTCKDPSALHITVEGRHFHDLCATVSTISRSFVSIGRKKHATAASKAANPYTAVANMRDDCMRTYRIKRTFLI
jgi:hypothetical protein